MKFLLAASAIGSADGILNAAGILCDHNIARCMHGVAPLTYNAKLHNAALAWANRFPNDGSGFFHGGLQVAGFGQVGQNMAESCGMGSEDGQAVKQWMSEESYKGGHYTQVIWRGSHQVGCGMKQGAHPPYGTCGNVICDYYPPGNFNLPSTMGANVPPRNGKTYAQCKAQLRCTPTSAGGAGGGGGGGACPKAMGGCMAWCGGGYSASMAGGHVTCKCSNGKHCTSAAASLTEFIEINEGNDTDTEFMTDEAASFLLEKHAEEAREAQRTNGLFALSGAAAASLFIGLAMKVKRRRSAGDAYVHLETPLAAEGVVA